MAGRGTDIQLGGNKDFRDEDNQKELSQIKEDKEKVKSLRRIIYYWNRKT